MGQAHLLCRKCLYINNLWPNKLWAKPIDKRAMAVILYMFDNFNAEPSHGQIIRNARAKHLPSMRNKV